jgi:hypothetical protein
VCLQRVPLPSKRSRCLRLDSWLQNHLPRGSPLTVKTLIYIVMVVGVMSIVLILGFASDMLGPFGSVIMMIIALVLFVAMGQQSGMMSRGKTAGAGDAGTGNTWVYAQPLANENWLDLVIDHQEMLRHVSLEIDRSRRFDRTFTVIAVAPDLKILSESGVDPSSESEMTALRLFIQEVVVRQLRTTDIISNSVMPTVTLALLPETDGDGASIAVERIREALVTSELTVGAGGKAVMEVAVIAVNYPADVRDTAGFIDSIKEFEGRSSSALPTG